MRANFVVRTRRILDAVGLLPAAFWAYKVLGEWRPGLSGRNRALRAAAPPGLPIPPDDLVFSVAASHDLEWFLTQGAKARASIAAAAAGAGQPVDGMRAFLDFGCGCGRVLRHWADLPAGIVHGSDYNRAAIAWVQEHLTHVTAKPNDLAPPLPFADGQFDLVYALSVFTHLTEELERAWLVELRRVLAPGGLLLITTQGARYRGKMSADELSRFDAGMPVVRHARLAGSNLCTTFHPEAHVRATMTDGFRVVSFREGEAPGIPDQDLVLLAAV